ncbi:MAG: hypothetical protein EOO59_21895, partial [Hymenobacter sp.]
MKFFVPLVLSLAASTSSFAQATAPALQNAAFAAYTAKNYRESGQLYDQAFALLGAKKAPGDCYNAGCSWALAGEATKAFHDLGRAVEAGWDNLAHLQTDEDLTSLHADKRWPLLLRRAQATIARAEAQQNIPLKRELEAIYEADQGTRRAIGPLQKRYGAKSPQLDSLFKQMQQQDARNEERVKAIIAQYGWPGTRLVGRTGSMAAFLVIQHSDLASIQKYLPAIREEAATGGLAKANLALMEDRVLVFQDKPQVYGSQVRTNPATGKAEFFPIADEAHVDERRATMGLGPLADYATGFGFDYVPA